jgi:hypothetical protein
MFDQLTILPREQLERRNTRNLLYILGRVVAYISYIKCYAGPRCCEVCHEFLGDEEDWQREVVARMAPYIEYHKLLKEILATREHVEG